jgi:hypothetical protein
MKKINLFVAAMICYSLSQVKADDSGAITSFTHRHLASSIGSGWNNEANSALGRTCLEPSLSGLLVLSEGNHSNKIKFSKNELLIQYGVTSEEDLKDENLKTNIVSAFENNDTTLSVLYNYHKSYKISAEEFEPNCKAVVATAIVGGDGLSWPGECGSHYVQSTSVGKNLTVLYKLNFKNKTLKLKFEEVLKRFGPDLDKTSFGQIIQEAAKVSVFNKKRNVDIEQKIHRLGGTDLPDRSVELIECYDKGLAACSKVIKASSEDAAKFLSDNNPTPEELPGLRTAPGRGKFNYAVLSLTTAPYQNSNWEAGKFGKAKLIECGIDDSI